MRPPLSRVKLDPRAPWPFPARVVLLSPVQLARQLAKAHREAQRTATRNAQAAPF